MKLRNRKTGEIVDFKIHKYAELSDDGNPVYAPFNGSIEEWEDYKETKDYWYFDCDDDNIYKTEDKEWISDRNRKSIGNYFETKEEAERAVEKLKAWKRLKDKGFRFKTVHRNPQGSYDIYANFEGHIPPSSNDINIDLNICFGGEE